MLMAWKWFSAEHIAGVLKRAEVGMPVLQLTRKVGISERLFYRYKKQYLGPAVDQVRHPSSAVRLIAWRIPLWRVSPFSTSYQRRAMRPTTAWIRAAMSAGRSPWREFEERWD